MKLGLSHMTFGPRAKANLDLIHHAENLGFDSVWTAEAWGSDAVSLASWILAQTTKIKVGTAIMQMPARSPAMTAMTAMTLDHLSEGRFILGLGPSGPQVAEGWHGVPYGKPLTRTKEYISIIRDIFAREKPLEHQGEYYHVPNLEAGSSGLGKPLKSILHGNPDIPIYTASISPNGLRCSGEVADGVFPMMLDPDRAQSLVLDHVEAGMARAETSRSRADFTVAPALSCIVGDYEQMSAPVKGNLALYIGGMGARGKNFYNDYARRMGFEEAAIKIQDLYLDGKKKEAVAAVPDALVDAVHLIGPEDKIRDRCKAWRSAAARGEVNLAIVAATQPEALEILAEELM
jgi:F420-dependent oxidoreductase-like protein